MKTDMIIVNKLNLPEPAEKNILEFLNYKLKNGKYMKQLSKDLPIYKLILERPIAKFRNYYDHDFNNNYFYEDTNYDYEENYSEEQLNYFKKYNILYKYFLVSFDLDFCLLDGMNAVKMMLIKYFYNDKNKYRIEYKYFYINYDGTRRESDYLGFVNSN